MDWDRGNTRIAYRTGLEAGRVADPRANQDRMALGAAQQWEQPDAPLVVLIDDARSFKDGRDAYVARTPSGALALLARLRHQPITAL